MSQPVSQDKPTTGKKACATQRGKTWAYALVDGTNPDGPFIAVDPALPNDGCKLSARLVQMRLKVSIWNGIEIHIPLGQEQKTNEKSGFGIVYRSDKGEIKQCNHRVIQIEFPRGKYAIECSRVSAADQARLGYDDGKVTLLAIRLAPGTTATIRGFGLPFANGDDVEIDNFVNKGEPMAYAPEVNLMSLLTQRVFHIFLHFKMELKHLEAIMCPIARPLPFEYPYGTKHTFNMKWYDQQLYADELKDVDAYPAATFFRDDNSRVAVLAQSAVQERWWIAKTANFIAKRTFRSYFVQTG
ncbi:hypothetical protein QBC38DRAFT_458527 [Podospora fimiseda]|uniref:Uncharacterized protein n=1 Tax=Podospora fimiseda TaxID=252190 RepID=A0AAN7GPY8_9PEZI|nr:hypothetical protein QBC38DRAFT_458527 [Podospora fimiseda]